MEATILGLEWEVTDEGLEKFNKESTELRSYLSGNTEAQVLVQGLQALGAYIREQKSNAHPDSFTILHSFYDALKMLLESPELGAEQRRQILLEQIGSLNSLKEVIARSAASKAAENEEEQEEETVEEEDENEELSAPHFGVDEDEEKYAVPAGGDDEEDIDFSFDDETEEASGTPAAVSQPAMKSKTMPAPPVAAPVKPAEKSEEDEFDDDLFSGSTGGGVLPALADEDETGSFSDSLSSEDISKERAAELDEKLDSFFNFGDAEDTPKAKKFAPPAPVVLPNPEAASSSSN
ncbi:hypothetical protein VU07_00665 [Desulfobulbus sp. F4]|nr:hypothetical protein [Desulfobulbus sp. F4]